MSRVERITANGLKIDRVHQDNGRVADFVITPNSYFDATRRDRKAYFNDQTRAELNEQKLIFSAQDDE